MHPNGQQTEFAWHDNYGDQRLEEIHNKKTSGGPTLSRFNYEYDPAGQITEWSQQQGDYPLVYKLGYDQAGQLVSARAGLGKSAPPYVHQYGYSYDPGANRTSAFKSTGDVAKISGSVTTSDVVSIIVNDASLPGGTKQIDYTVQGGDTLADIARNLSAAITSDSDMQSSHINAFAVMAADSPSTIGAQIFLRSTSNEPTVFKGDTSGGATESIELGYMFNGTTNAIVGGTATPSDVVTITIFDASLPSNPTSENYTVQSGDTLDDIATGLATAINANTDFQTAGITAQSHLNVLNIQSRSTTVTNIDSSFSGGATETLDIKPNINGTQTAIIGGSVTSSDVLTITIKDAGLSGGSISVNYTVQPGDSTSLIAAGIASAINASTPLQDLGITGDSVGAVLNIVSISTNLTTVLSSLSGGATETIALAPSLNISEFGHNNLNELNSIATGGITTFEGKTNKAVTGVTVDSNDAELLDTKHFSGNASLSSGANNIAIVATDAQPANKTENQAVHATGPASASPTFDANGNMTFDGTNTYVWDAENRLIRIEYPGIGNSSEFFFDAVSRNIKIVENVNSSPTATKHLIWSEARRCEERNDSNNIEQQFFSRGQMSYFSPFYFDFDHLSSVREVSNGSSDLSARYSYDLFGRTANQKGSSIEFSFANYYYHLRSSICLTVFRAYASNLGSWLSRDPSGEILQPNLYSYVSNKPLSYVDPLGLEETLWFEENCLGGFLEEWYGRRPDSGESLDTIVGKRGWVCWPVKSPEKCCCGKRQKGLAFLTLNNPPAPSAGDPFMAPWKRSEGKGVQNDYHFINAEGSGWLETPGRNPHGGGPATRLPTTPQDIIDRLKPRGPLRIYCCCKNIQK